MYLVFWCSADLFASTALPEEQLGQHEILRRQGGLRAPPQDDIVSDEGGLPPPFTPARKCEQIFLDSVNKQGPTADNFI